MEFPCPQNKLFQGDKGGQNGENPCVYGGLMVFRIHEIFHDLTHEISKLSRKFAPEQTLKQKNYEKDSFLTLYFIGKHASCRPDLPGRNEVD